MKQLGDFLDPSLPQLPHSSLTLALVYNVKQEASPLLSPGAGQEATPSPLVSHSSSSGNRNSEVSLQHGEVATRVNDIYAEWDTMETVNAVRMALEERHRVLMVEANQDAYETLRTQRPDFVFNIAEGLHGVSREAQMPALLEMLRIPYLGSDPLTLATCLDKARTKEILAYHHVPTAAFCVAETVSDARAVSFHFPVMVKPLHEGSSKGIYDSSVARTGEELEREVRTILGVYHEPALIEEFLPGREFTVGMLGNGKDVNVLPIVEISFDALPPGANPIYSYEAKWVWDTAEKPLDIFSCPARLTTELQTEIEAICRRAYHVLRCRDWSRIDVRLDAQGSPHIIEVNPLPGILPKPEDNSCLPKAARAAGLSYNALINAVLDIALARCGLGPHVKPGIRLS